MHILLSSAIFSRVWLLGTFDFERIPKSVFSFAQHSQDNNKNQNCCSTPICLNSWDPETIFLWGVKIQVTYNVWTNITMLLFCLLLDELQRLYHIINIFRCPLLRVLDRNMVICAISTVLLTNTPYSESPVKALRLRKRIHEAEKGGDGFFER